MGWVILDEQRSKKILTVPTWISESDDGLQDRFEEGVIAVAIRKVWLFFLLDGVHLRLSKTTFERCKLFDWVQDLGFGHVVEKARESPEDELDAGHLGVDVLSQDLGYEGSSWDDPHRPAVS